jgi:FkbM family methyltransferase
VIIAKIAMTAFAVVYVTIIASPWDEPRLAMIWAIRQAGGCPIDQAIGSSRRVRRMQQVRDQIEAHSTKTKTDGKLELIQTPMGLWWVNQSDRSLSFLLSEQQHEIYGNQDDGVHRGDVVLDCGANVGVFTRTALDRGARLVVAIELAPTTIECLRRNFAEEIRVGRVILYPKGVWNRPDTLEMALPEENNAGANSVVLGRESANKVRVPLTTIDLISSELQLDRVDFIKMDIEGAEKEALEGAANTIHRYRPRMAISCEHIPGDFDRIPEKLSAIQHGYAVRRTDCYDFGFRVRPAVLLLRFSGLRSGLFH